MWLKFDVLYGWKVDRTQGKNHAFCPMHVNPKPNHAYLNLSNVREALFIDRKFRNTEYIFAPDAPAILAFIFTTPTFPIDQQSLKNHLS